MSASRAEHPGAAERTGPPVFLRVEKGTADPVELAVLTVLLYARTRATNDEPARVRVSARWRRLERHRNFADPRAWSSTAR